MAELEVLIWEEATTVVDGPVAGAPQPIHVPALHHEPGDHAVEIGEPETNKIIVFSDIALMTYL